MKRKEYKRQELPLQVELVKLQRWVQKEKQRLVIIFEGRDAAGKGGAIIRFMQHLNPRHARAVVLSKPTETERGEWYSRGDAALRGGACARREQNPHTMGGTEPRDAGQTAA